MNYDRKKHLNQKMFDESKENFPLKDKTHVFCKTYYLSSFSTRVAPLNIQRLTTYLMYYKKCEVRLYPDDT